MTQTAKEFAEGVWYKDLNGAGKAFVLARPTDQSIRRHVPGDLNLHQHLCKYPKRTYQ
jgi:hypothetical protein